MLQRSERTHRWISGLIGLLLTAGCLPAPLRVTGTGVPRESTLRNKPSQVLVGASQQVSGALTGGGGIAGTPVAAPIISHNGGNVLSGAVRAPAEIISHNGGNIISHNGGNIVSNNGGGIISHNGGNIVSNNGGGLRIAQVPLAFTTVRLKDAAGAPVKDDQGHELVTKTDAQGNYTFPVDVKGRNLVIEADVEGQTGKLKSLLPKDGLKAGGTLDVDLTSTLTLAYILEQYVKGDLATFERLPKDIEAKARTVTETAIVEKSIALPTSLDGGAIVAKVDEVRQADPSVDKVFEDIRALLVVAGITNEGNGLPALEVNPGEVGGLLRDGAGNMYVFSQSEHTLWKVSTDGIVHTIVASGRWGYAEQNPGNLAPGYNSGMALDKDGNVVLADTYNNRLVRVSPTGAVTVLAGTGVAGFSGDGLEAKAAQLNRPSGVAIGDDGAIYVSDAENNRVRKIDARLVIATVCGTGDRGGNADAGSGTSIPLSQPQGLLIGGDKTLYIADYGNNQIRMLNDTGRSTVLNPASAPASSPIALAFDGNGQVLSLNHLYGGIELVTPSGVTDVSSAYGSANGVAIPLSFPHALVSTGSAVFAQGETRIVYQLGKDGSLVQLFGRSKADSSIQLRLAFKMAIGDDNSIYIGDMAAKKVFLYREGQGLSIYVGNGEEQSAPTLVGDKNSPIGMVSGVSLRANGDLLISSIGNHPMVKIFSRVGVLSPFIGNGQADFTNVPVGQGLSVALSDPYSPLELSNSDIIFSEPSKGRISMLDNSGSVVQLVKQGEVTTPELLTELPGGDLLFLDRGPNRIMKLSSGKLTQFLGSTELNALLGTVDIRALCTDMKGSVYVASRSRVARQAIDGSRRIVAGVGSQSLSGNTRDDGLSSINDLKVSPAGDLYILEDTQLKRLDKSKLEVN